MLNTVGLQAAPPGYMYDFTVVPWRTVLQMPGMVPTRPPPCPTGAWTSVNNKIPCQGTQTPISPLSARRQAEALARQALYKEAQDKVDSLLVHGSLQHAMYESITAITDFGQRKDFRTKWRDQLTNLHFDNNHDVILRDAIRKTINMIDATCDMERFEPI